MTKPRLLLTGGSGFVGTQILANIPDEFDIHCVSRHEIANANVQRHAVDLRDADLCRRLIADIRPTHLIHSAWETAHGTFWEAPSNLEWLEAGKALFSAFVQNGGQRIVGCGSCAEYGGFDVPITEIDDQQTPTTLYGRSKLELLNYLRKLPVSFAWSRIFLAYGPNEGRGRFVPSVSTALLQGEEARCSSGQQIRDFMDVRDLGRAIAMLANSNIQDAINLGHGTEIRIADIAQRLGDLAGRPEMVKLGALPDREGEAARLVPNLDRQINELKFGPAISLEQGLSDALDWWRQDHSTKNREKA